MTEPLDAPAESLIDAIRQHAAAMGVENLTPERAMPAINALRRAALDYVEAVFERTGWGNVFADLYDDFDDEDEEPLGTEDALRVSVLSRWDFIVRDEDSLVGYVRGRLTEMHPDVESDAVIEHPEDGVACVSELFRMDSWDAGAYRAHGLEFAGSGYTVSDTSKTLYEMEPAERDEAGF